MKNIAIYKRTILERRAKGFFAENLEVEYITDFTPKKQADFEKEINASKRVKFEKVGEFNLKTEKGKKDFAIFLLSFRFQKNQNHKAYELEIMLCSIINAITKL